MQKTAKKIVTVVTVVLSVLVLIAATLFVTLLVMLGRIGYEDINGSDYIIESIEPDSEESLNSEPDTPSDILESFTPVESGDVSVGTKPKDKVLNVLLIGCDSRTDDLRGRTDSMIMLTINETRKKILITSIMRDIYCYIPEVDQYNRVNAAYAFGGTSLLVKTIEHNFGIKTDRHVVINFEIFKDFINDIGGLEMKIEANEYNVMMDEVFRWSINEGKRTEEELSYLKNGGTILLDGKEALGYARIRHTAGGDFRRTLRQRKVLMQTFEQFKEYPIRNTFLLLEKYLPRVKTSFTQAELISYIFNFTSYLEYEIETWRIPEDGTWQYINVGGRSMVGVNFEENLRIWNQKVYG